MAKKTSGNGARAARLWPYIVYLAALTLGFIFAPGFTLAAVQMTTAVLVVALVVSPIGYLVQRRILRRKEEHNGRR